MGKYDDILLLSPPVNPRHPPMPRPDRAKQFMPFAALRGYDEAIAEKEIIFEPRAELSDEQRDRLDRAFRRLRAALARGERPRVAVCCFFVRPGWEDACPPMGRYRRIAGAAEKMNLETGRLRVNGEWLALADVSGLRFLTEED